MLSVTAFLSYVFVTSFTPGPNNILAMSNGSNFGYLKTLRFILGVTFGFAIIILLSSYLNLFLFNIIPKIKVFMNTLGFGYMFYLAFKILKSKPSHKDTTTNKLNSFLTGMALQFINPKGILYGITVSSSFILPYYQSNSSLFLFAVMLSFVGFLAVSCWALFGSLFQKFLSKYNRGFNFLMAALLIYSAISIIH